MESWPADQRTKSNATTKKRGNKKAKGKEKAWSYPVLNHGSLEAATLLQKGQTLEWTSIDGRNTGADLREWAKTVQIFPPSRSAPQPQLKLSSKKRVEKSAHFLRAHYPDIDIPLEILRDQLTADEKEVATYSSFDPFMGNLIESLSFPDGPRRRSNMLAFPMGDAGCKLNISPFLATKDGLEFQPVMRPAWSFETPIRQIISSSPTWRPVDKKGSQILAVRTFNQVSFLDVKNISKTGNEPSNAAAKTKTLCTIDASNIGSVAMDMAFSALPALWVVSSAGSVFKCSFGDGQKNITRVHHPEQENDRPNFWRVESCADENCFLLSSESSLKLFDIRMNDNHGAVFNLNSASDVLTSIGTPRSAHAVCLSTTKELLWLDYRNLKSPILGWRHHRTYDRTLYIRTIDLGQTILTLLSSKKTGYTTAYALSRHANGPLCARMGPRGLHRGSPGSLPTGNTFIKHADGGISFMELSDRGAVHCVGLEYMQQALGEEVEETAQKPRLRVVRTWGDDIEALNMRALVPRGDDRVISTKDFKEVNMTALCERLFKPPVPDPATEDALTQSVYDVLDGMSSYTRTSENQVEHLQTTSEIALTSGSDPTHPARADFLTGSALNTIAGHRAFKQNRIPISTMVRQAPWHLSLGPILHSISPILPADLSTPEHGLLPYTVTPTGPREATALDTLTLDLALSIDVFAPPSFIPSSTSTSSQPGADASAMLSHAAEGLSLRDPAAAAPPRVHFAHLRPTDKACSGAEDAREDGAREPDIPLGVRALLAEWDVGVDPDSFVYIDPYNAESVVPRTYVPRRPGTGTGAHPQSQGFTPTRVPPIAVVALPRLPPPVVKASQVAAGHPASQKAFAPRRAGEFGFAFGGTAVPASSQDIITSTQVLPGPFGGRQGAGPSKKKVVKKRVGGF